MSNPVIIGDCTLYLGDSMDILPTLGKVDAVVTDPPYGIDYGKMMKGKGDGNGGLDDNRWKHYDDFEWDKNRPSKDIFDAFRNISDEQIIWGGNYFTDYLPPSMQWLIWDKCQEFSLADFEIAWSSQNKAARIFRMARTTALQDGRHHPTQKPLRLMQWCIEKLPIDCQTILDPFMGSGTTGLACAKMGRKFIGIEREEKYFEIACKRIEDAYKQPDFFVEPPQPKLIQEAML